MSDFEDFTKLREEISRKIKQESRKEWTGRPELRDMEDVRSEIGEILKFIRENSLIRVFRDNGKSTDGLLRNFLHYAELKFGSDEIEKWLNVYVTKNPLLKNLKRPNLKGITLAKFLKEIEIWERDGQGNPVIGSDGKYRMSNMIRIRRGFSVCCQARRSCAVFVLGLASPSRGAIFIALSCVFPCQRPREGFWPSFAESTPHEFRVFSPP